MTITETLNKKLTHDGLINAPFYFSKGVLNDIELTSNSMAGAAYPMSVSFDLNNRSINRAIERVHDRFDFARSRDTDPEFYDLFESDLIKLLVSLK